MEKERRIKALAIVVLVIAVIGLTIAFAALSQTLTINGSAKLDASKWGLKFDNLVLASGNEYIEGTANIKTDDNTVIENMNVRLTTPGDKVVYTVDLVNEGSINAKIDKITKTTLTEEQSKYLSFKVLKENNEELNEGYVLGKETRIPLRIEIEFKKDITKENLPKKTSIITLSYGLTFVQTDEKEIAGEGQGTITSACTTFDKKDTYNVGDEIALCNNDTNKSEDFYVISDNGDTVTALAKYNLLVGDEVVWPDLNFEDLNKSDKLTQKIKETLVLGPQGYYLPITGFLNIQENKILQEIIQWKLGKDYTREQYFSTIVFPPWYWTFLLNTYNHRFFGYEPNDSPDMVLFYLAQATGKHITSIWNTEKQAESLSFGTFEEQLSVLKAAMQLYKHESAGNTLKLLEEAYLSNDTPSIKEILQTIQTDRADFYTTTGSRHYIDAAFTERVDLWIQTIMNLVQEKNKTFFIFTDLSLILQEDGIIDRLVDAGFVLTSR